MAAATSTILIGLVAAGTATQVVGAWKSGTAAKKAGEAQRRVAESQAELLDYNASVADLQAQDAIDRGRLDENRYRSQIRGLIGSQRAGYAAQGVSVAEGSPADVQADTAFLGELDALTLRQNAMREAWGYQVQAYDTRGRAEIARREGVVLEQTGLAQQGAARWAAFGAAASGAGNLALMRYGFNQATRQPPVTSYTQVPAYMRAI